MFRLITLITASIVICSCTFTYEVPYQDVSASKLPAAHVMQKMNIKAAYLPMDENNPSQKLEDNGSGVKQLMIMPIAKQINKSAKDILPQYFTETAVLESAKSDKGLIISVELQDFDFNTTVRGFNTCGVTPKLNLRIHFMDSGGRELYRSDTVSSIDHVEYSCTSTKEAQEVWNARLYAAAGDAFIKSLDSMLNSYAVNNYLRGQSQEKAPEPSPYVPDGATEKERLRAAFEHGYIDSAQLTKAIGELGGDRSKLLESFLNGKIDAKKFGELY
ncbi:hypothetical protein [Seleniivibrio woodruffii]|uniref:hypothetical protein n=1 Tax=Seleniivibrio woodruffii TaxID=1078050 RepID=UPI0026EE31D7|nr:hypothetical protein [Seleniivibrio woodruffii]